MKSLSQVLENMQPPSQETTNSTLPIQQAGSTLAVGMMNTLREMASASTQGVLVDDKKLAELLTQHFGSGRFVAKEKLRHRYGPSGYECESAGYELSLDHLHDGEMKIFDAINYLNKPTTPVFTAKLVARMRSVLARRNDNADDMVLLIDTYADHLEKYPPDVVATVVHEIIFSTRTWFPKNRGATGRDG